MTSTPYNGRAAGRSEGPAKPKMLPPTLTAFTSRLGHRPPSPAKSKASKSTASSGGRTYISSSAISFDSDEEDEWEDDCGPLRLPEVRSPKHDNDDKHKKIVFKRIPVSKPTPQTSLLSQMLRQQQASGMALAGSSSTTSTTSSAVMTDAQFPIDLPNPLRCHPTSNRSPSPAESDIPQLSSSSSASSASSSAASAASSAASSLASSPASSPLVHIPQVAGGLLFVHRSPRAIVDSTGPFTSMPFNGACGPRADPTVVVGAPPRRDICCNGRLLRGELSSTLHSSILDENNSRYIFRQYGSRRCVSGPGENLGESCHFPPVRRTQSAPDVLAVARDACRLEDEAAKAAKTDAAGQQTDSKASCPAMAISSRPAADTVVCRGVRDYRSAQFRKIEYVDDYVAPRSWSWGMDYHSKGW